MLIINATYFKKICTDVFGKDRVTFEEHVNSPYQQINCYVDQQPVAKFCINYYELTYECYVFTKEMSIPVNYKFTLKHYLKKVYKEMDNIHQKLFKIYSSINDAFPDMRLQDAVGLTIKYLTNVEYVYEKDIQKLYKELFESICHNNPKVYEEFTLDMAEYFMSKVKINRITCQYVDTQETEQLNNTEKEN